MIKWTTREYYLNEIFSDQYTLSDNEGTCGEMEYEFELLENAPYLQYDKELEKLTIYTELDEQEGDHTVIAQARLKDYPLAQAMDIEFKVPVIKRETIIKEVTSIAAWILMLFLLPAVGVGAFYGGRYY